MRPFCGYVRLPAWFGFYREPTIEELTISGFYTPQEEFSEALYKATSLSDELIAELREADMLLISTPRYNFSVPAVLKAWIDQIVRIGVTFAVDEDKGLVDLLEGETAIVAMASGAVFSGTDIESMNHLQPYLKAILGFLGFSEINFVAVEGTTMDEVTMSTNRETANKQIESLFSH